MRNIQSVPSTDSRFIQFEEKIFEELESSSQICYIFEAYVVFITKQVCSKVRKFADIILYNNIFCLFRMLTDFNNCTVYHFLKSFFVFNSFHYYNE